MFEMKSCLFFYMLLFAVCTATLQSSQPEKNDQESPDIKRIDMIIASAQQVLNKSESMKETNGSNLFSRKLNNGPNNDSQNPGEFTEEEINAQKSKTQEMVSDLIQITNLVESEFGLDRKINKCLLIKQSMEFLPAFKPVNTGFMSLFTFNKGKMPRTFRTVGMNLLEKLDILSNDLQPLESQTLLEKLREKKKKLYDMFIRKNAVFSSDKSVSELKKKMKSLKKLRKEIIGDKREMAMFRNDKMASEVDLERNKEEILSRNKIKTEKNSPKKDGEALLNKFLAEKYLLVNELEKIKLIEVVSDVSCLDYELIVKYKCEEFIIVLKKSLAASKSNKVRKETINKLQVFHQSLNPQSQDFKTFNKDVENIIKKDFHLV